MVFKGIQGPESFIPNNNIRLKTNAKVCSSCSLCLIKTMKIFMEPVNEAKRQSDKTILIFIETTKTFLVLGENENRTMIMLNTPFSSRSLEELQLKITLP